MMHVDNDLALQTLTRASAALRSSPMACLPEIVRLLRSLAVDSIELSVAELAEIIQKDVAILTKVLGVANTLAYNPAKVEITTVHQAIQVIGFESIRRLAMSLLLVQTASSQTQNEEPGESAALAITAGTLAQLAAAKRGRENSEQVFVCAALRYFGRMIMTTFMLEDFRQARQLAKNCNEDAAFLHVFGLTPLQLGHDLLKASELPDAMLVVLRDKPEIDASASDTLSDPELLALVDFGAHLAELVLAPQLTANKFTEQARALAERWRKELPKLAEDIPDLVKATDLQLRHFVRSLNIQSLPVKSLRRVRQRSENIDPPESLPPPAPRIKSPETLRAEAAGGWEASMERLIAEARGGAGSRALFSSTLTLIQRGLGAPDCLLLRASGNGEFTLAHGLGALHDRLGSRARARTGERTVLGVCLARRENVLIHETTDPKIAPYVPDWLLGPGALRSFALFPLVAEKGAHGLILAGWTTPRQITISSEQARLIRTLLAAVSQACESAVAS